jgi:glycosyltransferase involved in cell wall biosynthesis
MHAGSITMTSEHSKIDFTVAIPTYNGEQRLPEVLEKLRTQINTEHLTWEILVVDNNSQDNTAKVVRDYQQNWPQHCALTYIKEKKQGAGFARQKAIEVAKSPIIGFIDDDNLPAPDWVYAAYEFSQRYPQAGAYGSQIFPLYESDPPENFKRIASFLAITQRGSDPLKYEPAQKVLPPSAGLVVRKQAWLENVPANLVLTGRTEGQMLTSEDLEVLSHIQNSAWEIWYNPAMQIEHKIPHWRLTRDYLIPFMRGIGLSRHVTRMLSVKPSQRFLAVPAYMANDLRKIVVHALKYRTKIKTDLVTECEMQLYLSSLASPFFIWQKMYRDSKSKMRSQDIQDLATQD